MKKLLLAALAALVVGGVAYADGEWIRTGPVWFKNVVYAGSSRVTLTNSTGNLATTTGAFSGAVSAGALTATSFADSGSLTLSSVTGGVSAVSGGAQDSGAFTQLAAQVTTSPSSGSVVTMPAPAVGKVEMACNAAASNTVAVYAPTGVQINKESVNTAITLAAGECMFCLGFSTTRFGCVIGSAN